MAGSLVFNDNVSADRNNRMNFGVFRVMIFYKV